MEKPDFLNAVRSLFNIDGYLLPELTSDQQRAFVRDPVRYFIGADKVQSDAIWREVERRQRWDDRCTDCGGTGITFQTERQCACQPKATT